MNHIRCNAKKMLAGSSIVSQCILVKSHKSMGLDKHTFVELINGNVHITKIQTIVGFDVDKSNEIPHCNNYC